MRVGVLASLALGMAVAARAWKEREARRIELRGAVAVVTGGGRGLGLAISRKLAREGCRLAICGRDGAVIARAVEALRASGAEVMGQPCDASDPLEMRDFIGAVIERYGRVDVLVNNAAQCFVGPAAELETADAERALRNIFWVQYVPTMALLPHFRWQRRGRIVNVTSFGGKFPTPHQAAYAAGKFAATGWSETLAIELRNEGVDVSTITPPPLRDGAPLHAHFNGRAEEELSWFARTLTSPLRSTTAERAARIIVEAARYGDAERTVGLRSWLGQRAFALAPNVMSRLLSIVERRLPRPAAPEVHSPMRLGAEVVAASTDPRVQELARAAAVDELRFVE